MATTVERVGSRARPAALRLQPAERHRRARVPEIALGIVIIGVCALGSVLWQTSRAKREQIVVPAHAIARGTVLAERDLRAVDVNRGSGLDVVRWSERSTIVGLVALSDLPAAAPIAPAAVGRFAAPDPANRLVGLRLGAGDYPERELRPGTSVDVVAVPVPGAPAGVAVLAEHALVRDVGVVDDNGEVSVTIEAPAEVAYRVSSAAGAVRLVELPG